MNEKYDKWREIIVYIIVGVLTTIFCWVFNWVLTLFMDASNPVINFILQTINWCVGVSFAFPLNRKWVFRSKNPHFMQEFFKFAGSRITTWALDAIIMVLFVNVWPFTGVANWISRLLGGWGYTISTEDANYWFVKIFISSVLVMIFNYIFSKLIVFKKKNDKKNLEEEQQPADK